MRTRLRDGVGFTAMAMVFLAILSPVAALTFARLGVTACAAVNPLGLPWSEPTVLAVKVICALVILAYISVLAYGFTERTLRTVSWVLCCYTILVLPATVIAFALLTLGDGPCV